MLNNVLGLPANKAKNKLAKAYFWCATRQVDKLNNEIFFFPGIVHVPGCLCNVV